MKHQIKLLLTGVVILVLSLELSAQPQQPTLIVLSLDGFRWDYPQHANTPTLDSIARVGVKSEIIPSFPSKTFPNHYTLATGLTPDHHGIIFNSFYANDLNKQYKSNEKLSVQNPDFYGGEPIWNTAERQGVKSFTLFWIGAEAPINGRHASRWYPYQQNIPYHSRMDSILNWLTLPAEQRPGLIMVYFHEPDSKGHHFGPGSKEVSDVVEEIDRNLAYLFREIKAKGLAGKVNVIITTDHGMCATPRKHYIDLSHYISKDMLAAIQGNSPVFNVSLKNPSDSSKMQILSTVKGMHLYTKKNIPARLHFGSNSRIYPYILVADSSYSLGFGGERTYSKGNHGFDPQISDMHGIFYATGPTFIPETTVNPFHNVDLYDLMAKLLDIQPAKNDGNPTTFVNVIKTHDDL
ncbi:MAG TPA: ectonucleotide pyrophosphatase/phosphodiesterase [Williamwhitmania sp.]|nr:ectonucleotide pyrophosphatase/phosphodiesterase [Williamwhitmania sp.]